MWPNSNGVSISYGHDGSGIFLPTVSPDQPWLFARSHGLGHKFHDIGYQNTLVPSTKVVSEFSTANERREIFRQMRYTGAGNSFVPSDLMVEYSYESNNLLSPGGYDPTIGRLMAIGTVKTPWSNKSKTKGIAFADGKTGKMSMNIGVLEFVRERLDHNFGAVQLPVIKTFNNVSLESAIRQVEFCDHNDEASVSPFILARTIMGTSFVRVSYSAKLDELMTSVAYEITSDGDSHVSQVHSCFDPSDWKNVGIVHSNGKWSVYNLKESRAQVVTSGLLDRQNLSVWHRLMWGEDSNSLWVANRKTLSHFDLREKMSSHSHFALGNDVAQICDLKNSDFNSSESFVLTSDKIHWLDNRVPGKPVVSWDHFLHSKDPSLQMCTSFEEDSRVSMLSLYSQLVPANVVYQFTESNGFPVSADDPYYFLSSADTISQTVAMMPLTTSNNNLKFMAALKFSTDCGLFSQVLSTNPISKIATSFSDRCIEDEQDYSEDDDLMPSNSDDIYFDEYTAEGSRVQSREIYLYDFRKIYDRLFGEANVVVSDAEHKIQDYAYVLGSEINNAFQMSIKEIVTLKEIAVPEIVFANFDGFSLMIQQLQEHYSEHRIKVFQTLAGLGTIFDSGKVNGIGDIYDYLLTLWDDPLKGKRGEEYKVTRLRRQNVLKYIAIEIALALVAVRIEPLRIQESTDGQNTGGSSLIKKDPLAGLKSIIGSQMKHTDIKPACGKLLDEWDTGQPTSEYTWTRFGAPKENNNGQLASSFQVLPTRSNTTNSAQLGITSSLPSSQPISGAATPSLRPSATATAYSDKRRKKRSEGFA